MRKRLSGLCVRNTRRDPASTPDLAPLRGNHTNSEGADDVSRSQTLHITSDAFCPPKPKLFESAVLRGTSRAVLGT